MASTPQESAEQLMQYLPAIYRRDPFIGRFLLAFEQLLLGHGDGSMLGADFKGLEEIIADLPSLLDPYQTPRDFLPWLASWAAFSLRADLEESKQRDFVARVIPLYRRRGTAGNLRDLLSIFTVGTPEIDEPSRYELQIGDHSQIGVDTYLSGGAPHFFRVTIRLLRGVPEMQDRQRQIAHALVDLEKPAHTYYDLRVLYPSMQIGVYSTVGVDTQLGTATETAPQ